MKLLCKLVTNPLKPTACAHPINLCNSLGSGLSDLHHCVGCSRGPWLESVTNFPFFPVALSWRPSLFPLGASDIRHNTDRRGEGDIEREADIGVMQHKPRIVNSHQKLGVVFPEPQEGRLPA